MRAVQDKHGRPLAAALRGKPADRDAAFAGIDSQLLGRRRK
ncbi:hypothetical protein [Bradyrhizobium erythrophlei]|nr:hypothetical protein [Bradyrhizobium erythrophlei]